MDEGRVAGSSGPTTYNLLFVCTGNTCRSPMAEAVARHRIRQSGWTHVEARSAGVAARPGLHASEGALLVSGEAGLSLAGHRSQPLTPDLVDWADLILAMGPAHLEAIEELGGGEKAALLTGFLEGDDAGRPIADPFGYDIEPYRIAFAQIDDAVTALLRKLEPILSP
jgi:protein-tyrosine-phosphatase